MKRIITILIACMLSLSLVACRQEEGGQNNNGSSAEGSIVLRYWEGGYGTSHIQNVVDAFNKKNPNSKVELKSTTMRIQVVSDLAATTPKYDLYLIDSSFPLYKYKEKDFIDGYEQPFIDLTDVYQHVPEGENKTIEEKINDDMLAYTKREGKYYGISYGTSIYGFTYNTVLMNKYVSRVNGGELPRTTNELAKVFDALKNDTSYSGYALIGFQKSDYWNSVFRQWWVQYEGMDNFNHYCDGQVYDSETETYMYSPKIFEQMGRLRSYQECQRFLDYTNGYIDPNSTGYQYMTAQANYFDGNAMMMVNGGWLETEMRDIFEDDFPSTLSFMKTPVMSSVIEKCSTISDDAELSALIKAIDNGGTSLTGTGYEVSQADFDKINEARNCIYTSGEGQFCFIPANSRNVALSKEFLKFMYSNEGIEAYTKAAVGCFLPIKDYDYSEILDGVASLMYKENAKIISKSRWIFLKGTPLVVDGGLAFNENVETAFCPQNAADRKTAKALYDYTINYYTANNASAWNNMLTLAGIK